MAFTKTITATCDRKYDGCEGFRTVTESTIADARVVVEEVWGWTKVYSHDLCPNCAKVSAERDAAKAAAKAVAEAARIAKGAGAK